MYGLATGDTIHWDSLCSLKTMYMSIHTATVVKRGCWQIYSSISSQSMMFGSTIQKMRIPFRQLKCRQAKIHMMTIETCCFPKSHIISPDIGNEIRLQIDLILPVIFYITRKVVLSGFFSDTFFEVDYRTRGMLKIAQFKWFMQHLNI